jgi:hypothetical protein
LIVRVVGLILVNHAHDSADELDVRRKASEWPEDRGDAQRRVIEAFSKHLYLYDAVKPPPPKGVNRILLFVLRHLREHFGRRVASLLVEGPDLASVIDGACHRDELVGIAGRFAGLLKVFKARVHDVAVAFNR